MTAPLDRIAALFVAPRAEPRTAAPALSTVLPTSMAVCGAAAVPTAAALALVLAGRRPALVCAWGAPTIRPAVPATSGARRLTAALHARGIAGRAIGRLAVAELSADPALAVAEATRAAAACDTPVILALAGPRAADFDTLLAVQDVAVLAGDDVCGELTRLALTSLAEVSRSVVRSAPLSPGTAWLARAGIVATPAARRALAAAVEATASGALHSLKAIA